MANSDFSIAPAVRPNQAPARSSGEAAPDESWGEDRLLVELLVQGDKAAWSTFVHRFERLILWRVAAAARELRAPVDQAELEDLAAEVFSRLVASDFDALRRFEGRSSLSTWLCVVTRRIAIRALAAARRDPCRQAVREKAGIESLSASPKENPLAQLIHGENHELLGRSLRKLEPRDRSLVNMLYVEGCTYREISQRLAMPMNSIGPTLMRIQKKLRKSLEESSR